MPTSKRGRSFCAKINRNRSKCFASGIIEVRKPLIASQAECQSDSDVFALQHHGSAQGIGSKAGAETGSEASCEGL